MTDPWLLPAVFLFSFLGTGSIISLAKHKHWLDIPNGRSSHSSPTPKGGGLAFVITFILAVCYLYRDDGSGFNHWLILLFTCCIALLGLADDIYTLGIKRRITVQFLMAAGALFVLGVPLLPLFGAEVDLGPAGYLPAAVVFLWFINLFNFMDGIDGIAALETLFVCLAVYVIGPHGGYYESGNMLLLLVAAVSGFLLLNFPPARVFMGDAGSNFLGYMLGVLGLLSMREGLTNLWVWSILLGVFVVDATYTLCRRMLKGDTWYHAHRSHAYQVAARYYASHGKVDFIVMSINILWLFPLAWLAQHYRDWGVLLTLLAYLPLAVLVHFVKFPESETPQGESPGRSVEDPHPL